MAPTMKDLGIDRLNTEQRVALALEIWESLGDARPHMQLTAEQRAELSRRDAELDANPGIAMTWEQIRASVERKPLACGWNFSQR
jgi:putative addiction module component (TIGR02574 family)